jgi:hypothetical protein
MERHRLTYHRHSAFDAFEQALGGSLLLDHHYRCHPEIAEVANQHFYQGELVVLTDPAKQHRLDKPPIIWTHGTGSAQRGRTGSWVNEREGELVDEWLEELLRELPEDATVGVVTPFQDQAEQLSRRWERNGRIRFGTVHKFQGGERDVMVLSLVAGRDTPRGTLWWLESQPHLWNVAITRARSHLIVVGNRDFWLSEGGMGSALVEAAEQDDRRPPVEVRSDPLASRLHKHLLSHAPGAVELLASVNGYTADAALSTDSGKKFLLLDRGSEESDPAAHLSLQYERLRLLRDDADSSAASRVPAWRLFDREFSPTEEWMGGGNASRP